nr:hypothetical protein [Tanacetum cinerariifolium]
MMPIARMLALIYTILAPYGIRPRPIFETNMEAIFQEMKEKQEASDKAFEEVRLKSLESDIVDKKSISLSGTIKKPDKKKELVTVGLTWNDTIADLNLNLDLGSPLPFPLDSKAGCALDHFNSFQVGEEVMTNG